MGNVRTQSGHPTYFRYDEGTDSLSRRVESTAGQNTLVQRLMNRRRALVDDYPELLDLEDAARDVERHAVHLKRLLVLRSADAAETLIAGTEQGIAKLRRLLVTDTAETPEVVANIKVIELLIDTAIDREDALVCALRPQAPFVRQYILKLTDLRALCAEIRIEFAAEL